MVKFPIEGLDLSEFVKGNVANPEFGMYALSFFHDFEFLTNCPRYDLFAVSQHIGGLGGGHYTAVVRHMETKDWYSCNDTHVSPTEPESAVNSRAYVLFYIRRKVGVPDLCHGVCDSSIRGH